VSPFPYDSHDVEAAINAWPKPVSEGLKGLRTLILQTAANEPRIGPLTETLKWGQPAYLPKRPKVGTTVRIDGLKDLDNHYALFVHCQTSLIETWCQLYPDVFRFEGNRALVFSAKSPPPLVETAHCILMALTYHLDQ